MSGIFGSSQWMYASGAFYNGVATQSLRFNDGSSAYLSKDFTGSSPDNDKKMTISVWAKRANLSGVTQVIIGNYDGVRFLGELSFRSTNTIGFRPGGNGDGASNQYMVETSAVFRDVGSWYHIVLAYDSTQSTDTNRVKLYVNGTQQTLSALSGMTFPPLNYAHKFSYAGANNAIGYYPGGFNSNYLDGYLSEFSFIDGLALDPTSFGEFKNGVWIAKEYTGSYGTNGFRLQFNQTGTGTASSSTIGADTSGNANHFTSSGIVASDCDIPDSPENNFATFNVLSGHSSTTISEGNLRALANNSSNYLESQNSTFGITSGKWYAEFRADDLLNDGADNGTQIGVTTAPYNRSSGNQNGAITGNTRINLDNSGGAYLGVDTSVTQQGNVGTYADGDIIGVALNVDDSEVSFYKNGSAIANAQDISITDVNGVYFFEVQIRKFSSDTSQITANFGQDSTFAGATTAGGNTDARGKGDFKYSVPSGYLALCSANLPEPTISPNEDTQADDYFNTVLYTGNGSTQSITGVGFQPDLLWIKGRSFIAAHVLQDTVRGANKAIYPNLTNAEDTNWVGHSFDTDGFTVDNTYSSETNNNSNSFVAWNWKAGGTAVSNTDGSITSSVSANTDAGFSIVSYTGTGVNATVGHGLNVAPNYMIIKSRDSAVQDWTVYSEEIGNTKNMALNTSGAEETATTNFNSTNPTSSVFSIGTRFETNESGAGFVAYCFHNVEGYSKFGSYTANGSADGPMIYLGFRPKWVLIKKIDGAASWWLVDAVRDTYNPTDSYILPDTSDTDRTYTTADFLSNGFKIRNTSTAFNSGTHIYMAFAEAPFKYANAR